MCDRGLLGELSCCRYSVAPAAFLKDWIVPIVQIRFLDSVSSEKSEVLDAVNSANEKGWGVMDLPP